MAIKRFTGDADKIGRILEARIRAKFKALQPDEKIISKALMDVGNLIATQAKLNITARGLVDTGTLRERTRAEFTAPGLVTVGVFGVPYARIHEFGGDIEPKTVQWLTIPTPKFKGLRARDIPNLFFVRKDAGTAFLLKRLPSGDSELAFTLKKRVHIKPKPYLAPAIERQRENTINILLDAVRRALGSN